VLCTCSPRIAYSTCELASPESVYQNCDWFTKAFVLIAIEPYEQPFTSPVNVPFSPRRTTACCTCRLGRALDQCDGSRKTESIFLNGYMNRSPLRLKVGRFFHLRSITVETLSLRSRCLSFQHTFAQTSDQDVTQGCHLEPGGGCPRLQRSSHLGWWIVRRISWLER
jgi:hypothetical protein